MAIITLATGLKDALLTQKKHCPSDDEDENKVLLKVQVLLQQWWINFKSMHSLTWIIKSHMIIVHYGWEFVKYCNWCLPHFFIWGKILTCPKLLYGLQLYSTSNLTELTFVLNIASMEPDCVIRKGRCIQAWRNYALSPICCIKDH